MLIPVCAHLEDVITVLAESASYLLKSLFESLLVSVAYHGRFRYSLQTDYGFFNFRDVPFFLVARGPSTVPSTL